MRAGLLGGGARNQQKYQRPSAHRRWVNSKGRWYYARANRVASAPTTSSNIAGVSRPVFVFRRDT